jgi:hypothetical protein
MKEAGEDDDDAIGVVGVEGTRFLGEATGIIDGLGEVERVIGETDRRRVGLGDAVAEAGPSWTSLPNFDLAGGGVTKTVTS